MVSGGCHFLSCNDVKRFGEVQVGLLCICLFRMLQKCRGELQALAMPICVAGPKVGGVSGPTNCKLLASKGGGFCYVDPFKFCNKAMPL